MGERGGGGAAIKAKEWGGGIWCKWVRLWVSCCIFNRPPGLGFSEAWDFMQFFQAAQKLRFIQASPSEEIIVLVPGHGLDKEGVDCMNCTGGLDGYLVSGLTRLVVFWHASRLCVVLGGRVYGQGAMGGAFVGERRISISMRTIAADWSHGVRSPASADTFTFRHSWTVKFGGCSLLLMWEMGTRDQGVLDYQVLPMSGALGFRALSHGVACGV